MPQIEKFGIINGETVWRATITNSAMQAQILSFGAITKSLTFSGRNTILGYETCDQYAADTLYVGAIAGRVANRIENAHFTLNGVNYNLPANEPPNQLHGGQDGLSHLNWKMDADGNDIVLTHQSTDMAGGYPALVEFMVRITLSDTSITYHMTGRPDAPTPINMAQHNYYNLGGNAFDHELCINAPQITPITAAMIPTGKIEQVHGMFDYRKPRKIERTKTPLDHNFVLERAAPFCASLIGTETGLRMVTDQVGLQVYTGAGLKRPFEPFQGICLEPQYFPNSVNQSNFPSCIHSPDDPYDQTTHIEFFDA